MATGKRKRGAGFSERDKFEHKSATLLQREAKKVRSFLARKAVQQLKQQQAASSNSGDADSAKAKKQCAQIQKRERELAALKTLDLKQVVARAFEVTGLKKDPAAEREDEEDHDVGSGGSDDEVPAMADEDDASDSGFDSEEYENARGIGAGAKRNAQASSGDDSDDDDEEEEGEGKGDEERGGEREKEQEQEPEQKQQATAGDSKAEELNAVLVERVLAHKQMVPLLDAIRQWLKKEEREEEKRVRRQEKRALKRGRKEALVGGRSAAPPSSMFLGSLSGRGGVDGMDDDDAMDTRAGQMAGADDDIAEFLGEKKKKNRAGQMARRQKAIRQEEARKRKEDRERGIFRPFNRDANADGRGTVMGKYGPSERPKKPKKQQQQQRQGKDKQNGGKPPARKPVIESRDGGSKPQRPATNRDSKPEIAHPSWLAKQAQKEKERVSITAFSGKKITFD